MIHQIESPFGVNSIVIKPMNITIYTIRLRFNTNDSLMEDLSKIRHLTLTPKVSKKGADMIEVTYSTINEKHFNKTWSKLEVVCFDNKLRKLIVGVNSEVLTKSKVIDFF